jgi:hypothetical protein
MISFIIRPEEVSSNKFYSGCHWSKRKKIADKYHYLVKSQLSQKLDMINKPVEIIIKYNNKFDIDNQGIMSKMIIDALKGVVIKDDSRKYFKRLTQEFWEGDGIKVEIMELDDEI